MKRNPLANVRTAVRSLSGPHRSTFGTQPLCDAVERELILRELHRYSR